MADQLNLRWNNLALVLRELRYRPRTRARLADDLGMSKGTVGSLVNELEQRGMLSVSRDTTPSTIGRPGHVVNVVDGRVKGIGISLSGVYLVGAVVDLWGVTVARYAVPLESPQLPGPDLIAAITALVKEIVEGAAFADASTLLGGIAVGVPDLIDTQAGIVRRASTLGLKDFPLRQALIDQLGDLTTHIEINNDANLGALAEARVGASGPLQNLLYLTGSLSIGGGVVADGRLFRGRDGYAGEIGHVLVDPHGKPCSCGNVGCLESVVGLDAFLAAVADPGDYVRDVTIPVDDRVDTVIRRAEDGDERTLGAIDDVAMHLGLGLSTLMNAFNPGTVVLGGYLARLFGYFIGPVSTIVQQRVISEDVTSSHIVASKLGLYAGAIGAGHQVVDRVAANPAAVPYVTGGAGRIDVELLRHAA